MSEPIVKVGTVLSVGKVLDISKNGVTIATSSGSKKFTLSEIERIVK